MRATWLPFVAIAFLLLPACPPSATSSPGRCTPAAMANPPNAASYAFDLAASGDWGRYEREAAIPHDLFVSMLAGRPNAFHADPEQLFAMNRQDLGSGFQHVHATALAPMRIDSIVDDSHDGLSGLKVVGTYRSRS